MKLYLTQAGVAIAVLAVQVGIVSAQQTPFGYGQQTYNPAQRQAYRPGMAPQQVQPAPQRVAQAPGYGYQAYPAQPRVAPQQPAQPGYGYAQQQRVAMSQSSAPELPAPTETLNAPAQQAPALSAPTPSAAPPVQAHSAPATQPAYAQPAHVQPSYTPPAYTQPAPAVASSYPAAGSDCGCNQSAAPAAAPVDWQSYTAPTAGGCSTGNCGGYADTNYAAGGCADYGVSQYCDQGPQRQWFFGAYGLYMGRDRPSKVKSAVLVDGAPAGNYYPQPTDTFLTTSQIDPSFTGGAEIRFGSTFGCATDACGCTNYQPFAWEVGYWGLAEDSSQSVITDTFGGTTRLYGMIDYSGLEYDRDGAAGGTWAYRPVNDYYDYQIPIDSTSTNDVRVLGVRVRQSFQVQNLELNFWRFGTPSPTTYGSPSFNGLSNAGAFGGGQACGTGSCGYGAGSCGTGSCGAGSCGTGAGACGYNACGCQPALPAKRFFISGLAGVRYLKMDETFENAIMFTTDDGTGTVNAGEPGAYTSFPLDDDNNLFDEVQTDNDLLGFQLGCSMNCLVGCRWTLFADTNFGIYGNQIDSYRRVFSGGGGDVRFVGVDGDVAVRNSKTDVAFLGEVRTGVGYQLNCKWRLTAAYRAVAISGVALAGNQIRTPVNQENFGHIDSNGSIVIHGLQTGIECKY